MTKTESIDIKLSQKPENIIQIMRTISRFYNNSVLSVIREYTVNALDEHRKHNISEKVVVALPTNDNPYFTVRDYAKGLSKDDLINTFVHIGDSSRRDNIDETGGFGYGSKAGLGYADKFVIESYNNGSHLHLDVQIDPPKVHVTNMGKSDEPSGLFVKVESKPDDIIKFEREALNFFAASNLNEIEIIWGTSKGKTISPNKVFQLPKNYDLNPAYVPIKDGSEKLGWVYSNVDKSFFIKGSSLTIKQAFGPRLAEYANPEYNKELGLKSSNMSQALSIYFSAIEENKSILEGIRPKKPRPFAGKTIKEEYYSYIAEYLKTSVVFVIGETPYLWGDLFDVKYFNDEQFAIVLSLIPPKIIHDFNTYIFRNPTDVVKSKNDIEFIVNLPANSVEVLDNRESIRDTPNNKNALKESFIYFIINIRNAFKLQYHQYDNDTEKFNFFINNAHRIPDFSYDDAGTINYTAIDGANIPLVYEKEKNAPIDTNFAYMNHSSNAIRLSNFAQAAQGTYNSSVVSPFVFSFMMLNRESRMMLGKDNQLTPHVYVVDVNIDDNEFTQDERTKIAKDFKRDIFSINDFNKALIYPNILVLLRNKHENIKSEELFWKNICTDFVNFVNEDDLVEITNTARKKRAAQAKQAKTKAESSPKTHSIVKSYRNAVYSSINGSCVSEAYDPTKKYYVLTLQDIALTGESYIKSFKRRTHGSFFKKILNIIEILTKTDYDKNRLLLPLNSKQEQQVKDSYPGAENAVIFIQKAMQSYIKTFPCTAEEAFYSVSFFNEGAPQIIGEIAKVIQEKPEILTSLKILNNAAPGINDPILKQYLKIIEHFETGDRTAPALLGTYRIYKDIVETLQTNNVVLDNFSNIAAKEELGIKKTLTSTEYAALTYQLPLLQATLTEPLRISFYQTLARKNAADVLLESQKPYTGISPQYIPSLINPIYTQILNGVSN